MSMASFAEGLDEKLGERQFVANVVIEFCFDAERQEKERESMRRCIIPPAEKISFFWSAL